VLLWDGCRPLEPQDARPPGPPAGLAHGRAAARLCPELNPVEGLWANLKGVELANFARDTMAQVADQAQHGIQRVCDSDSLVVGFPAHTGLSLENEPSP
jgi:hypothetical protein